MSSLSRAGRLTGALLLLALAGVTPAAAAPGEVTVDFETGPAIGTAITTEYQSSAFVFFQRSDAQRPARRPISKAGGIAADIGAGRCAPEGGIGNDCEFPTGGAVGRLTRTASAVSLRAGLFSPVAGAVTVQLQGLRANGTVAATGTAATISGAAFSTPVSVTSPAPDIAQFRVILGGPGAQGAAVGIDDLTMTYPAGTLPDVSLGVDAAATVIPQGGSVDVPVSVTRLNGSNGPLDMSASSLPLGVSATFIPNPLAGTGAAATLRLTAVPDAPPAAMGVPTDLTVTADPHGDAGVAPEPRSIAKSVRVASQYDLRAPAGTSVSVPACTSTDLPLRLERSSTLDKTVHLAALGLPPGVTASFTPGPDIAPGGNFFLDVTLRLTGSPTRFVATPFTVEASAPGAPTRRLTLNALPATPTASLKTPQLRAPQRLQPGTDGRIEGNGFCPGTTLRLGTAAGTVTPTVATDGLSLSFPTPRLATSGPIVVVPPSGAIYQTAEAATVETFRSTKGLSFPNFPFTGLSLTEAADVFGYDELFFQVNLCWPLGTCLVPTGIPDPTAFIAYAILDRALQSTGGHCFGISRAVQGWTNNRATLNPWTSGDTIFSIPGRSGALDSYLDGQHALQGSSEFINAYFDRPKTLAGNLSKIRSDLGSGNWPLVSLAFEDGGGHAVIAYDLVDRPDGGADILVYDNNQEFQPQELTSADSHTTREADRSVIHVNAARSQWTFNRGSKVSTGGGDKLFASSRNAIPSNPALPGGPDLLDGLAYVIFGSGDGSVRTTGPDAGAEYLPELDDTAQPGAAGVVGRRDGKPITHTVRGVKSGRYSQAVVGKGSVASIETTTADGVQDQTSGVPGGDGVRFEGLGKAPTRPVSLDVGTNEKGSARRATVSTRSAAGGSETVRLAGGRALEYTHDGPATTVRITLQSVQTNGGPASFSSGPLRVGRGERLTLTPTNWRTLSSARLKVRARNRRVRTLTLRNQAGAPARFTLSAPKVKGRKVTVRARFGRLPAFAAAGVVLRATRGGKRVAFKTFKLATVKAGSRSFSWTLPSSVKGRGLRLVADATLAVGGVRSGSVRRSRSVPLRVR